MSEICEAILKDRQIAYLVTDKQLNLVTVRGSNELLNLAERHPVAGVFLLEIVPELIGSEEILAQILTGDCPRLDLAWVNRPRGSDETAYINMVTLPHRSPAGEIIGLIHIWQDVTEFGQINQQLVQHRNTLRLLQSQLADRNEALEAANAELQQLLNLKSLFVSFAAHELGSPLTAMMGHIDLLLEGVYGPLNPDQYRSLTVVERSISRLKMITGNLLVATKIELGRMDAMLRPTDLVKLVSDVVAEMQPQIAAKSQRLEINVAPNLPQALCDTTLTAQIIQNLISNATKYTQFDGEIIISVWPGTHEGFLQVSIKDTGIGIPAEEKSRVFDRFTRLSSANQTKAGGTGLGLYITRSLVDLHGGQIWFESEEHKGSTFHVTFPVAASD